MNAEYLLVCRHSQLLLFSIVATDTSSWQLVFQHHLTLSAAVWDVAFLTEQHLLVLQAAESQTAVVCTLSAVADSGSVTVIVVVNQYFNEVLCHLCFEKAERVICCRSIWDCME